METAEFTTAVSSITQIFAAQKKKSISLRNSTIAERKVKLKKLKSWVLDHRPEIHQAVYADLGKAPTEADIAEVQPVTTEIGHTLSHLSKWARTKKVPPTLTMLGTKARIQIEPKGVCLIIAPWNFPFNLSIGPLVSAIAAGNTVMLKPSEFTPHTSQLMADLIEELFDEDEVSLHQGGVEVAKQLLELPFDHIFFTGSPQVGKIVMAAAAKHLTSITLELGGKSPSIVDETANVNDAARKLAWGKFLNCGQTCIAPDYIYVHESICEELITRLKYHVQHFYDPEHKGIKNSSDYARIVNGTHFNRLKSLLEKSVLDGGNVEFGADLDEEQKFISPTIVSNVTTDNALMKEELFGPILPIIKYKNLDDVIDFINSRPKPLALYLYTKSSANKKKVLQQTSSGGACINENVIQFSHLNLPFGGVNNSGIGKSHGVYGFLAFSNEKTVLHQRIGVTSISFFYPPYTNFVKKTVDFVTRYI